MPLGLQFFAQGVIILDDTVMDDDQITGAVAVGMGVDRSRCAVGSPAGVAKTAVRGCNDGLVDDGLEVG